MGEQHLDPFALAARMLEGFGLGQCPGNVTSLLVDATRDNAERRLRTALRLELTAPTVDRAREITKRLPIVDQRASRGEDFVRRADVNVALLIEPEVRPAECSILTFRFVDHRDVWRDCSTVICGSLRLAGSKYCNFSLGAFGTHTPGSARLCGSKLGSEIIKSALSDALRDQ
jgi:hypothetical protein